MCYLTVLFRHLFLRKLSYLTTYLLLIAVVLKRKNLSFWSCFEIQ